MKKTVKLFVMAVLLMAGGRVFAQDTHEYVDLGLPSGTLWATCNVGANTPEEAGDYYAWGETTPKAVYDWKSYKYCKGSHNSMTKYYSNPFIGSSSTKDGLTVLLPEDDAATVNWGSDWCMPTKEQWEELVNNTTCSVTTQNGVNGVLVTAQNGRTLFFPCTGYRYQNGTYDIGKGSFGSWISAGWSSTLNDYQDKANYGCYTNHGSNNFSFSHDRCKGLPVRPVRAKK